MWPHNSAFLEVKSVDSEGGSLIKFHIWDHSYTTPPLPLLLREEWWRSCKVGVVDLWIGTDSTIAGNLVLCKLAIDLNLNLDNLFKCLTYFYV